MNIQSAEFVCSNTNYRKCPEPNKPEFAFIGRSNVGKSSLINTLTNRKGLAKTSGTPGKTQVINHFIINGAWYLVDLPGYGFAKTSLTNREKWEQMIREYLVHRTNLLTTFVLIDSRIKPQTIDLEFMSWMGNHNIPFAIAFTKTDKLTKNELHRNMVAYEKKLLESWEQIPERFITSSESGTGTMEILSYIETTIPLFE
ncbi:MAG: putative GTP-binding protein EngB [Bacteroidetes bacterium ADurb.Bin397]|jgi:GTP-binding protein|nr:YihA family ribosome biogenesis GTP-binding protein [Bacteroidia bacterium]OQA12074.1 MAG: putative GTP-binding protein EngB [Bacteroidetes bacterium ADurb.Bin397]